MGEPEAQRDTPWFRAGTDKRAHTRRPRGSTATSGSRIEEKSSRVEPRSLYRRYRC